jgi:hypothetical protein
MRGGPGFAVCTFCLLATAAWAQTVVYNQPNDGADGPYSDGVPGQYYSTRIADNFVLSDTTNRRITEITWWGSSENISYPGLDNVDSWIIRFYEQDDAGLPGDELYSEEFLRDAASPVFTGNYNMDGGEEYEQHVELTAPPSLYVDQPYWISIGADLASAGDDAWHWSANYFDGDDEYAADYFDGAGYHIRPEQQDVAFVLWGEPASGCPRPGCEPGDIDGDCDIDLADLGTLLAHYGETGAGPDQGDLNGDTNVDLADLALLLAVYGNDCN